MHAKPVAMLDIEKKNEVVNRELESTAYAAHAMVGSIATTV
jgi:hypothetical protein